MKPEYSSFIWSFYSFVMNSTKKIHKSAAQQQRREISGQLLLLSGLFLGYFRRSVRRKERKDLRWQNFLVFHFFLFSRLASSPSSIYESLTCLTHYPELTDNKKKIHHRSSCFFRFSLYHALLSSLCVLLHKYNFQVQKYVSKSFQWSHRTMR